MPTAIVSMGNAAIIAWTFSLFTAAAGPCSLYVEPLLPHMVISYGNISYLWTKQPLPQVQIMLLRG